MSYRDERPVFRPAWWLRNAHAQTIWGKLARSPSKIGTAVECVTTPDADGVELHHLMPPVATSPRVFIMHGLEGSLRSHYVGGMFEEAARRGWGATLMLFRGCGAVPNVARRFYHSGETSDAAHVFGVLRERWPDSPWFMAAVSLGGNVLLKWLGEQGDGHAGVIRAAAAVSVPFDLEAGARHIARGAARIYDRSFVRSLRAKALRKLDRYPGLFDREALRRARTVIEFDEAVTAPVHGFESAHDYYTQSSSMRFLARIRVPTLLLSAADDPFMPSDVLDRARLAGGSNPSLTMEFWPHGGHVGFVAGSFPSRPFYYAEWRVFDFFDRHMERRAAGGYD